MPLFTGPMTSLSLKIMWIYATAFSVIRSQPKWQNTDMEQVHSGNGCNLLYVYCCYFIGSSWENSLIALNDIQGRLICWDDVGLIMKKYEGTCKLSPTVYMTDFNNCNDVYHHYYTCSQQLLTYLWHGYPLKPLHMSHLDPGQVCCSDVHSLIDIYFILWQFTEILLSNM